MKKIKNTSLFKLKNISQTLVTENNVFYLETKMNKNDNDYQTSIYRLNLETKERTYYGDSGTKHSQMMVSPDETHLSYLSNNTKDKKMQIFIMPLTGGSAVQLTQEKNGVSQYLWVKESQSVYYQTFTKKQDKNEKKSEDKQPDKKVFTKLKYKTDGIGYLSEDKHYQIKKIHVSDLNQEMNAELVLEEDRSLTLGYVAKDESYLLYFDRFDPDDEWIYGGTVFRYDLLSKERKNLTTTIEGGIFNFALASADERYFLFIGNDFSNKFVSNDAVYLYDQEKESLTNLTKNLDFGVGDSLVADFQQNLAGPDLQWLEDGQSFIFKVTEHGKITLYEGDIQGNVKKRIDKDKHITSFALTKDKKELIVSYSDPLTPSKLAKISLNSKKLIDLYDPNANFSSQYQFTRPESFWYSSVDNWKIQGWYLPPSEIKEKHPAILYVHGGPQVSYGESFFHEMQVLSAQGYGVIMINPRGGSGYGQEFVASILNNYGDEDYQDLLNGLDYVCEKYPAIDQERLYLTGGSYGGFMTNWMVTHTDRFRAAVTQRSISNWLSFYGTSDIGPSFVEFQLGRDLNQANELWKMSPLAYASDAKTPLLIIHGEEDYRCPLEQAEQFYITMKKYKVDTQLIVFPESSHGLSRNGLPNLRIQRLEEIQAWFKQYS